jgi:hypothetical protein
MTITQLRQILEPLGWRFDGVYLTAPSGGYSLSESDLASPIRAYLPVARRREAAQRDARSGVEEYDDLLRALEADPAVSLVATQVRTMAKIVAPWAAEHHATLSLWDFSLPTVRATARHPAGGIACVEGEALVDGTASVAAMYWCDDYANGVRRGWTRHLRIFTLSAAALTNDFDEALHLLLGPHEPTWYKESRVDGTPETAALMQAWEDGLEVLL